MDITSDKRIRTKQNILKCAEKAFLEKGYHKTDMSNIAKLAEIDKRTIYRYYSSKEALAFAIWTDVLAQIIEIGMDVEGNTGYDKINKILDLYIENVLNHQDIIRFLGEFDHVFSENYPEIPEADEFVSYIKTHENAILIYLKEGVKDKSIREDIKIKLVANTISNIMLSLCQRVIIRGNHLEIEQGHSLELLYQGVELILKSIKA